MPRCPPISDSARSPASGTSPTATNRASAARGSTTKRSSPSPASAAPTASSTTSGRRRGSARSSRPGPCRWRSSTEPALRHHHLKTGAMPPAGDPVTGRVPLLANDDVILGRCRPAEPQAELYRNADADEVLFVHRGRGTLHTMFGPLPFRPFDYVVIPRCTTYRLEFDAGAAARPAGHRGGRRRLTIPPRYLNPDGQLRLGAPYSERDLHGPREVEPDRPRGGDDRADQGRPPADALHAGEPPVRRGRLGRHGLSRTPSTPTTSSRSPAPSTSRRRCSRRSRPPGSSSARSPRGCSTRTPRRSRCRTPIPTCRPTRCSTTSAAGSAAGAGVEEASFTLHPRGIPHGPHPGTIVASRDLTRTDELAVMVDTVRPLGSDPAGARAGRPALSPELAGVGRPGERIPPPDPPGVT